MSQLNGFVRALVRLMYGTTLVSGTVPDALAKFGMHVKKKEHALYGAYGPAGGGGGSAMPAAPTRMTFDD